MFFHVTFHHATVFTNMTFTTEHTLLLFRKSHLTQCNVNNFSKKTFVFWSVVRDFQILQNSNFKQMVSLSSNHSLDLYFPLALRKDMLYSLIKFGMNV